MQCRPFLTATWRHLAVLNFECPAEILAPLVPAGTELDFHDGRTFVSVVGFLFLSTRLRGWTIPCHRDFEEINLRFYVRRHLPGEVRRGVVFIKEIVPRPAVAAIARWVYGENYVTHSTRHHVSSGSSGGEAEYAWRTGRRWNHLRVAGHGPPRPAAEGSQEHFIIEHYWGYTRVRDGITLEYRVDHPSWNLWQNCQGELDCDAVAVYGPQFGEVLTGPPHSALLADGSDVSVYPPNRLVPAADRVRT